MPPCSRDSNALHCCMAVVHIEGDTIKQDGDILGCHLAVRHCLAILLVFDEFDSLVPKPGKNDDNNQANEVAEFLTQLNNCAEKGIYVIATTNRLDAIDQRAIRAGRLDEIIYIGLPDEDARKELIELELANRPHEVVDTRHLAQLTKGYTSSDIAFIIKECARCSFE